MNQHFDRKGDGKKGENDNFEDRMAALSLTPHSEDYNRVLQKLQSQRPSAASRFWPWLAIPAALTVLAFIVLPQIETEQPQLPLITPVAELNEENNPPPADENNSLLASLQPDYLEGIHYAELATPVSTGDSSTVQVHVFFWYPCNPCDVFEPLLQQWAQSLPDNVTLVRTPTVWAPQMRFHARVYYTAQALGLLDQVHNALFQAFQGEMPEITNAAELQAFFANYDVSATRFDTVFNSPGVDSQVERAVQSSLEFDVQATPSLFVDGRYRVGGLPGGHAEMLRVTDYLIELVQEGR
jgi:thiol:disulfide interchange protein DsbA